LVNRENNVRSKPHQGNFSSRGELKIPVFHRTAKFGGANKKGKRHSAKRWELLIEKRERGKILSAERRNREAVFAWPKGKEFIAEKG